MADQKADSEIAVFCADCEKVVAYATEITLIKGGGAVRIDPDKCRRPDNLAPIAGENLCPVDGAHTLILKPYAFKVAANSDEEDPPKVHGPRALVEKEGVSIRRTWNRKTLSIDEMLDSYPFGEVLLAMDKAGWKWRGETPTFKRIKEVAGELLRSVDGRLDRAETGGLEAVRSGDEYTLRFPSLTWKEGEEKDLTAEGEPA